MQEGKKERKKGATEGGEDRSFVHTDKNFPTGRVEVREGGDF